MKKSIWLMAMVVMLVITGCVNGNKPVSPAVKNTGVEYYVDTESRGGPADDNNPGTKNKPWKTIARAVGDQQPCPGPGDTIFIREGTYREMVVLTRGGSANQPLVLKGYGKEKPAAQGSAEADLAKNRRVEIRY